MNFDNLMHYELMTGLYRLITFPWISLIWLWQYSLQYLIRWMEELNIHSFQTVRDKWVNEPNATIVTYEKKVIKGKPNR